MKLFDRVLNPREIRRRLGLNQEQFWTQIGVTQSGGSRYESGREMPKPVRELLRLVHVEQIDLSQVKRVDFEIISYLKESHPDLYRTLRRAVKGRNRAGGAPLSLDDAGVGEAAGPAEATRSPVASAATKRTPLALDAPRPRRRGAADPDEPAAAGSSFLRRSIVIAGIPRADGKIAAFRRRLRAAHARLQRERREERASMSDKPRVIPFERLRMARRRARSAARTRRSAK